MADDEREESGPSLELPSIGSALGFGRKRRGRRAAEPASEAAAPEGSAPQDSAPEGPAPYDANESHSEPVAGPRPIHEPDTPAPVPAPDPVPEPAPATDPTPAREPVPTAETSPAPDLSATTVLVAEPETASPPEAEPEPGARKGTPRRLRRPSLPALRVPGLLAAVVTGALVGLAMVGLTVASLHLCSAMRGTSSCGKPGVFLLFAITVAMVFLGALLLRVAHVESPGSTSFLGVGLLVALILLLLLPVIFSWWMVVVIPALGTATYAAGWWLTSSFTEPGDGMR